MQTDMILLEGLGQEEALLDVVVGGVGGVYVLYAGETPTHPAVFIYGLEGGREGGKEEQKGLQRGKRREKGRRGKEEEREREGRKRKKLKLSESRIPCRNPDKVFLCPIGLYGS